MAAPTTFPSSLKKEPEQPSMVHTLDAFLSKEEVEGRE
jgi:hypothetical protein